MKNKNIIASMFDDTEPYMPSQQQEEGIANTQGTLAETEKSDTYGYLQKLLELERKITTTQQRQIEIQAEQKRLSAQLQDSCKNFKVSLSRALPAQYKSSHPAHMGSERHGNSSLRRRENGEAHTRRRTCKAGKRRTLFLPRTAVHVQPRDVQLSEDRRIIRNA